MAKRKLTLAEEAAYRELAQAAAKLRKAQDEAEEEQHAPEGEGQDATPLTERRKEAAPA